MAYGYEDLTGVPAIEAAREAILSQAEVDRRKRAENRTALYEDRGEDVLRADIDAVFDDATVRERLKKFVDLACSEGLVERVIDEISRPVYSAGIVRRIRVNGQPSEAAEKSFAALALETDLDDRMDLACHLANLHNDVPLYIRYVPRLGRVVIEVLRPEAVTVLAHPDDALTAAAVIYDIDGPIVDGKPSTWRVYWDDRVTMMIDHRWSPVPLANGGLEREHGLRRMPFAWAHRVKRCGSFWASSSGESTFRAHRLRAFLRALATRFLKVRGFSQIVADGEVTGLPKGQTMDGETALVTVGGTSLHMLSSSGDASHYLGLAEFALLDAAANRGLSRARINQTTAGESDDTGLFEQRAELVRVMARAEADVFDVLKMVSAEHDDATKRLPADATMAPDFGELQHRVDRKTQLENRKTERSMGLRSVLDDIMEDQPEIATPEQAREELRQNLADESAFVLARRALNIPADATVDEPGQNARDNGAMGTAVRDGDMSKDEAASRAKTGAPQEPNQ